MKNYDLKSFYNWPFSIQAFLLLIIVTFGFYICYIFDINMLKDQLLVAKTQEQELKKHLIELFEKEASLNADLYQFPKLKELKVTWEKNFPGSAELTSIYDEIIKLAKLNQIELDLFDPTDTT